jgi:hypothetical protein
MFRVVALRRMTLGNSAGPFSKTPPTTTLSKVVNGLVYGSSLLTAAVSSDHAFIPEARRAIGAVSAHADTSPTRVGRADDPSM